VSVFAPEGSDLGDAKKISSKDIVVYNEGARSGGIGKATIVEGLIAECVVSCKQSLDVVYYNQTDMSIEDALISSFKLIGMELMNLIDMLSGYHDAALRPKHRACRQIVVNMLERMRSNDIQEDAEAEDLELFAKDAVRFFECMHVCMLEETDRKKRHRWKKRFLDG
tara:strand:- start:24818 stop:25318 length:501 start_codon:yes stop_codon:yes gene_type:complete